MTRPALTSRPAPCIIASMADPTLADVMALLHRIDTRVAQNTGLLIGITNGVQLMAQSVTDLAAQIDAATNQLAADIAAEGLKLDSLASKLSSEGTEISAVADRVAVIQQQLAALQIPQATLDSLASVAARLSSSSSTVQSAASAIDASTTTLDSHITALQGIPAVMPPATT